MDNEDLYPSGEALLSDKPIWLYHKGHFHSGHDSLLKAYAAARDHSFDHADCRVVKAEMPLMKQSKVRAIALAT